MLITDDEPHEYNVRYADDFFRQDEAYTLFSMYWKCRNLNRI